jgi:hypothetical protein
MTRVSIINKFACYVLLLNFKQLRHILLIKITCKGIMLRISKTIWSIFLISLLCSLNFTVFSCAHRGDWAKRIDWDELDFAHLPGQDEFPEAGAVILFDEGKIETIGDSQSGFSLFSRHRIVKIINSSGYKYCSVAIAYNTQSIVDQVQARTISPEGKITILDQDKIYDVNLYPNFVFYSDQRAKMFTFPAVENGVVLEYSYQINLQNRTSLIYSWNFQNDAPTLLSRFILAKPSEWDLDYRVYGIDVKPKIKTAPEGFKSSHVWETRNVPALKSEFGMPPWKEVGARLALTPLGFKSWDDVAGWYHELIEPQMKAGQEIKKIGANLTKDIEKKEDKLRVIYEWVRDEVRYIAVEIGIGAHKPHPAEEIFVNRYGDCKDMTTLLCAISREAGLDVYQALISTRQNGIPDTSLAAPSQFNHVIAYCPSAGKNGIWMDATAKGCSFGQLPWYDQELPVLLIAKNGKAEILTTPHIPVDSNSTMIDWQVELKSSGAAAINGKTILRGSAAHELREDLYYSSPSERRRWLETSLALHCSGAKLDSFQIRGLKPVSDPLIIEYNFHTATFAIPVSESRIFRPGSIWSLDLPDFFRSDIRNHPIRFSFGLQRNLNLNVKLPEGWVVHSPDLSDSLTSSFGNAAWRWFSDDHNFRVQSRFLIFGDDIDPSDYQKFQIFLDQVREKDLRNVVILKK